MELTHSFAVPLPPDQAWAILTDLEQVAPCMPGATLESVEQGTYKGSVKVKVGPMQLTYRGEATFVEQDEAGRTARIDASARETRGPGTAKAVVRTSLVARDGTTIVTVRTTLNVTGRPAQFGRGVMEDVGNKLLGQFADCLSTQLEGSPPAVEPAPAIADAGTPPPQADDALDLLGVAGWAVVRRLAPIAAVVAVVILLLRRRRR